MKHSITGNIQLADDYSINIDKLFEEALKEIYGNAQIEEAKQISPSLFKLTNDPLQHAVDSAFAAPEFGKPEQGFLDQFKYNTGVFAAFKAHAEQKLLVSLLLDENGNLRSFHEFRKAVKAVNIQWNDQWLRTEYNTAVRSARSAANYQDALRSKDTYPNLEYLVSNARDKREEHLELVGTILPIEDPFWDIYLPPWDWNCQCSFRHTDKPATGVPKITQMIPPTFQNNPGKTAEFVKLNEHPYLKGKGVATCPECRRQGLVSSGSGDELCQMHQQANMIERLRRYENWVFKRKNFKSGGYLEKPDGRYQNGSEQAKNEKVLTILAKQYGRKVRALPVINDGDKNPDGFDLSKRAFLDIKVLESMSKTSVQNAIKEAQKQNSYEVVIYIKSPLIYSTIWEGMNAAFQKGRAKNIKQVTFLLSDGTTKKYKVSDIRKILRIKKEQ